MAAEVQARLARLDQAIELMQVIRKETVELFAELHCQKDLFAFEEEV
jgi:hypothetical protein